MDLIDKFSRELKGILNALAEEVRGIRAGRPSASLLDAIKVDYHGSETPIKHLGNVSVTPPREIKVQVWDNDVVKKVADAISTSDLGINANAEGNVIRIFLPELSRERREELVRHVKKVVEEHRIRVRRTRDDFNKKADSLFESNEITEDIKFKLRSLIQEETDKINGEIDAIFKNKEEEINE